MKDTKHVIKDLTKKYPKESGALLGKTVGLGMLLIAKAKGLEEKNGSK